MPRGKLPISAKATKMSRKRVKESAKPNPKAPLGQGGRFAAIKEKAAASGARNPAAVAAAAGIKKYGKAKMAKMAAKGRKRA